ncbi:hypothetical protein BK010_01375 [Tenericutes bacterium MO-XQ]|jgi:hypothetical protein|nr:hypothetical protein BK010_01375 [Tenericutes bacterium MO-XQ]
MMKHKVLQLIVLFGLIATLLSNMFNVDGIRITGIEAMFSNEIMLFGNIIMIVIVITSVLHLIYMIYQVFPNAKLYDEVVNGIVSVGLLFGLLMITFLGLISNVMAWLCVLLMVLSALIRYKFLVK